MSRTGFRFGGVVDMGFYSVLNLFPLGFFLLFGFLNLLFYFLFLQKENVIKKRYENEI